MKCWVVGHWLCYTYPVDTSSSGLTGSRQTFVDAVARNVDGVLDDARQLVGGQQEEEVSLGRTSDHGAQQGRVGVEADAHRYHDDVGVVSLDRVRNRSLDGQVRRAVRHVYRHLHATIHRCLSAVCLFVCLRPNFITLSSSRPGLRPARGPTRTELVEIARTCLRHALGRIPLRYPGRRPSFRLVADRFELSRHVDCEPCRKRLNRSRCRSGCELGWVQGTITRWGSRSPHGKGQV